MRVRNDSDHFVHQVKIWKEGWRNNYPYPVQRILSLRTLLKLYQIFNLNNFEKLFFKNIPNIFRVDQCRRKRTNKICRINFKILLHYCWRLIRMVDIFIVLKINNAIMKSFYFNTFSVIQREGKRKNGRKLGKA